MVFLACCSHDAAKPEMGSWHGRCLLRSWGINYDRKQSSALFCTNPTKQFLYVGGLRLEVSPIRFRRGKEKKKKKKKKPPTSTLMAAVASLRLLIPPLETNNLFLDDRLPCLVMSISPLSPLPLSFF